MNKKNPQMQLFLNSKPHYNLRNPKGEKPTSIYLIINIGGKQYKVPTGVKILPLHWNKKKYEGMISVSLSELDNMNNLMVNKKIIEYNLLYSNFIDYLCNNVEEIENPIPSIENIFGLKKKVKKEKISATLLTALRNHKMSEASYKVFYGILSEFLGWLKENNYDISLDELSVDIFKGYKDYLFNDKITHKITGEKVCAQNNTVLSKLENIITIIGYLENKEDICIKLKRSTKDIKTFKQEENQVFIDDNEIEVIYNLELEGEEEKARDIFIFQLSSCQRYSDIYKLCGIDLKDVTNGDIVSIVQTKTKTKVSFPINDKAKSVLEKYNYVLPKLSNNSVNKWLKKICKKAKLNEIIHCVELRGGDIYEYNAEKWQLVGTHTTRRTFISNAIKDNVDTSIIRKISGHKSATAFERYNRIDADDAVEALLKARSTSKTSGNGSGNVPNDNGGTTTHNELEECRKVLFFLGASPVEVYQDDDIERIHRLIFSFENVIAEKSGVDYKFLKDLFNSNQPFIDKLGVIQNILNQ